MGTSALTRSARFRNRRYGNRGVMNTLLWILAVVLVVAGVFAILRKQLIWGIVLIIVGLLVGPGGVSIFT
ncbi:hypothetical protein GCM10009559_51100 [Pseudonocardia zijingensis]|jgi:hypothetical protein|uniref:Uncharacterized protein n=1 Tax=Pseudonocardia zijingensis TaxID=153376 RepID=A0ABP3YLW7_9PSEU